jgi:predicted transposase YbfD/YdcC
MRLHGHYRRLLQDLPAGGRQVLIAVTVRRLACGNPAAKYGRSPNRWGTLPQRRAGRTSVLRQLLELLALALRQWARCRLARRLDDLVSGLDLYQECDGSDETGSGAVSSMVAISRERQCRTAVEFGGAGSGPMGLPRSRRRLRTCWARGNETTQVKALVNDMDIAGALVSADAAHTCAETARYLVEDKYADYLLTIKGNRPSLLSAATDLGRGLIATEPDHRTEERGHGRINRWTTWITSIAEDLRLPHAARLALIRRDVADLAGHPLSKEIAFVITSRAHLSAAQISAHTRRHWGIENLTHRPRDTIWREDDQQAHTGNGPRTMATSATWPSACSPSTASPRSNRPCRPSAATRYAPSHSSLK